MSIEGQGHFFTIYFLGFVCLVLYWAKISGERLQDHWSSGYNWDEESQEKNQFGPRSPGPKRFWAEESRNPSCIVYRKQLTIVLIRLWGLVLALKIVDFNSLIMPFI